MEASCSDSDGVAAGLGMLLLRVPVAAMAVRQMTYSERAVGSWPLAAQAECRTGVAVLAVEAVALVVAHKVAVAAVADGSNSSSTLRPAKAESLTAMVDAE